MHKAIRRLTLRMNGAAVPLDVIAGSHQDQVISRDGVWERHVSTFLIDTLGKQRPAVFFDVGANVGYYSVIAGRVGARVVAFEPNPVTRRILESNLALNDCSAASVDGRVVGRSGQRLRLISPDGFEEGAFAADDRNAAAVVCLDAYCAKTGTAPTVVKIDAEGRDLDILHGALETLAKAQPVVVFEFQMCMIDAVSQTKPPEIFAALSSIGYTPMLFRGHSLVAAEVTTFDIMQQTYDLFVSTQNGGYWDVVLWPHCHRLPVKQFDRSRLLIQR